MELVTVPNDILTTKTAPVDAAEIGTPAFQQFCDEMIAIMKEYKGIGIAAPQVGRSSAVMVVNTGDVPTVFINPVITKKSLKGEVDEEGCLSIPGRFGLVKRAKQVRVRFTDRHGQLQEEQASGLFARVIQHEIDHLNGILFTSKMIKEVIHE